MKRNLSKQPKWVQNIILELEQKLQHLEKQYKAFEKISGIPEQHDWYIVRHDNLFGGTTMPIISISDEDILILGRKRKNNE